MYFIPSTSVCFLCYRRPCVFLTVCVVIGCVVGFVFALSGHICTYVLLVHLFVCVCAGVCVRLHINCVFSPQLQQASVPVSYTVTPVPPHGLAGPLCSGQHLPPTCSSQQQVPACSVVFSTGQHYHPVRRTLQFVKSVWACSLITKAHFVQPHLWLNHRKSEVFKRNVVESSNDPQGLFILQVLAAALW